MESTKQKKQFSLSMLMRIFLAVMVIVSLVIFANSVMKYNKLVEEEKQLEAIVYDLRVLKEKLTVSAGSAERLSYILSDYEEYQRIINSGTEKELASQLVELELKKKELDELLNNSENKEYIIEIARQQLGLYFPDEEIYYSNIK